MDRLRALVQETVAASVALTLLATLIAVIYWLATKESPWPFLVLAEVVSSGWGLILLIATSPTWRR
jgi:hypothetical protein